MILLDTDVLIEILRGREKAQNWIQENSGLIYRIHAVSAMELVQGAENKRDLQKTIKFLETVKIEWPTENDFRLAYQLLVENSLSYHVGVSDYLIAASCLNQNSSLLTFNLKHFSFIEGLQVSSPYAR